LGVLLLATLFCYGHLADDSLWLDEIYTIWTARLPWSEIPAAVISSGSHAPLWFWISHPFVVDGAAEEFLLRFPAALARIVAIAEDICLIGVDSVEEIAQRSLAERQLWGVLWHHAPLGQPSLPTGWEEVEFAQVLVVEAPVPASPASLNALLELFLLYLPADAPRYHTELALAKVAALAGDTAAARGHLDAASRIRPGGSYADRAWERAVQVLEGGQ